MDYNFKIYSFIAGIVAVLFLAFRRLLSLKWVAVVILAIAALWFLTYRAEVNRVRGGY